MKSFISRTLLLSSLFLLSACSPTSTPETGSSSVKNLPTHVLEAGIRLTPISHATAVMDWEGTIFYSDPVGGAQAFDGQPTPDIVFVTDIHGDHLDNETLQAVLSGGSTLIIPQAVADELPEALNGERLILANGESITIEEFTIEAIPMYNLPEAADAKHTKGRGNGYLIEKDGKRVYFSGDTADIAEMRSLENIDIAFICMNLPYTMGVEDAADAVLDFKPKKVLPYHYRTPEGFSDVERFKSLVNAGDPGIEVIQLEWYPQ